MFDHDLLKRFLNGFALLVACNVVVLIGLGGLVTSHEAGMAVPDWPNSFGYNMFLFPVSRWVGGVFFEHTHRLVASVVGLLTIVLYPLHRRPEMGEVAFRDRTSCGDHPGGSRRITCHSGQSCAGAFPWLPCARVSSARRDDRLGHNTVLASP